MSRDFRLSMGLDFKDNASRDMARTLRETRKQTEEAARSAERQGKAQQKAAADATQAEKQYVATQRNTSRENLSAAQRQVAEYRRAARAREVLGVRSEQAIQREIDRTTAAYHRLARSGTMTSRELARAHALMKGQVVALKTEMGNLSRAERARMAGRQVGMVTGGLLAGASVVTEPIRRQMTYQESLTRMTNTAFGDRPVSERQSGMVRLDKLIRENVQQSGLGKEDVLESLETLLASGMEEKDVEKILPVVTRYASSSGTSGVDLARLSIKAKSTFGIGDDELPRALNMAVAAGQAGNFELRDMAKWLGPQLAAAANAGMSGLDDFGRILSLNELSAITAGSNDEAGNNVVNLLAKLTSSDAAHAAARIKINGKGIDLPGTLAQARQHNIDPIEAFSRVIDKVVRSDPKYRQLQQHLSTVKKDDTEEMSKTLTSMAKILEGAGVGKILVDRQALMAMLAYRNGSAYKDDLDQDIGAQRHLKPGEKGAGDLDFDFNAQQPWFQAQRFKNTRELSELDAIKPLADSAGKMGGWLADLGDRFPALATAVSGATTAIESMTAAALTFAGLKLLFGNKIPGIPGMPKSPGTPEMPKGLKGLGLSTLLRAPLMLLEGYVYEKGVEDFPLVQFESGKEKRQRVEEKYGPTPDEIRNVVESPGLSDVFDEWRGWWHKLTGDKDDAIPPRAVPRPAAGQDIIQPGQIPGVTPTRNTPDTAADISANHADRPLNIHTHFYLDGQELAEKMTEIHGQDALRSTGGGF
ncbi:phage tail tape measure protein [Salmonella enterica]|nr:phage tail tape measure protein [Salmonella enterica]EDS8183134.1 phage tail tape measure protein [Salmonella enterica]EEJ5773429.1 phage tail tape measure protein [Salmonella enterica]EFR5964207.1 phage tail tape measure protein [Salmonella enterica]EGP5865309.1 phage tail tape measure protein [Salmonella enterica]